MGKQWLTFLGGSKITADGDCSHEIKRHLLHGRKAMTNLDSMLKSRDISLPTKVRLVKAMVFQVVIWMCELDYKESWAPKNWCFWTVVLEKTLETPLDCKEIQPVNPKGNQSWIFTGRTDSEAEAPILWPLVAKSWLIWKTKIMSSGPITSWQIDGETMERGDRPYFLGLQNLCGWWPKPWHHKTLAFWKKGYDKPREYIKKQRHHFANQALYSQNYGFSSSHVWMWELDHKEAWASQNWCFWTVVLEKTLGSPLHCMEIKPVNPEGNLPWVFIGRTDAEAPILGPPDAKN